MKKIRIISVLLSVIMLLSVLPVSAPSAAAAGGRGEFPQSADYYYETFMDEEAGKAIEYYHYQHPGDAENLRVTFSKAYLGIFSSSDEYIVVAHDVDEKPTQLHRFENTGPMLSEDVIVPGNEFYIYLVFNPDNTYASFTISSIEEYTPPIQYTIKTWNDVSVHYGYEKTISNNSTMSFQANKGTEVTLKAEMTGFAAMLGEVLFDGWYVDGVKVSDKEEYTHTLTKACTIEARSINIADLEYTVTFETSGGKPAPAPQKVLYDNTVKKPADPVLEHYTFNGWYYWNEGHVGAGAGWAAWNFNTFTVDEDITLTALYTPDIHTITFDGNGGQVATGKTKEAYKIYYGKAVSDAKLTLERTGYTFTGWYSDKACTKAWDIKKYAVTRDMTLYAGWKGNPVTITLKGAVKFKSKKVKTNVGNLIAEPKKPSQTGYNFKGWYKDSRCTKKWNFKTDTITPETKTIYSKWQAKKYTIKYNSNGGTKISSVKASYDGPVPIAKKKPKKANRAFEGWYLDKKCKTSIDYGIVKGNRTVYAKWVPYVTTKLNANGGKFGSKTTKSVKTGKGFIISTGTPTRSGYAFTGWYKDKACKTRVSDTPYIAAVKGTLYAGWAKTLTVKFSLNGGSGNFNTMTVRQGNTLTINANPTRSGYTFAGWYSNKSLTTSWKSGSKITKSITLYAKWTKTPVKPAVSISKNTTLDKTLNHGGKGRDIAHLKTTLLFSKAGTYTIQHEFRSGSDRKMYKSTKETMKANESFTLYQDFILTYTKNGSCTYYIRVLDSSGKTVLEKSTSMPWTLSDIGTDMSIEG